MTISESTSSTADSDAQATSAADDELSTRFHSELIPLLEPLYRHAMRMTRNHADAEDLLQDTMVKACASLRSRKHNTNLGGWLFRIMTNTYTDMYRKQRRHPVQGVAATVLAINHRELPERGWHIFTGLLSVLAGMVVVAWPISSIVVLAIVAGAWLVVIGTAQIVWAVKARNAGAKVEHVVDTLKPSTVG